MTLVHNGQDEQPTVRVRIRPEQAGAVSSFGNISTDDAKKAALERMRVEMQERAEREDDEDEEAA
jgi:hypothetical protein